MDKKSFQISKCVGKANAFRLVRLDEIHPVMVGKLAEATSGPLAVIFENSREWRGSEDWKRPNILAIKKKRI